MDIPFTVWYCLFCGSHGEVGSAMWGQADVFMCENCPYLGPEHPDAWVKPNTTLPAGFDAVMSFVHPHRERPDDMYYRIKKEREEKYGSVRASRMGVDTTPKSPRDAADCCTWLRSSPQAAS